MKRYSLALITLVAAPLIACSAAPTSSSRRLSNSSEALTIQGTFNGGQALDNARAVAIGADGRVFASYLDRAGRFTLKLPVGHAYRVVFANSTFDGSEVVIGHLALKTSAGIQQLVGVRTAGTMDLGVVAEGSGDDDGGTDDAGDTFDSGFGDDAGDIDASDIDGGDIDAGNTFDSGFGDIDAGDVDAGNNVDAGDDDAGNDNGDYGCHQNDGEDNHVCRNHGGADRDFFPQHNPGDRCSTNDLDDDASKAACAKKGTRICGQDGGALDDAGTGIGNGLEDGGNDAQVDNGIGNGNGNDTTADGGRRDARGHCRVNAQCGPNATCCGGACSSK